MGNAGLLFQRKDRLVAGSELNSPSSILNRRQSLNPNSLCRADPRFFFHNFTTSGFDCFESSQLPGMYRNKKCFSVNFLDSIFVLKLYCKSLGHNWIKRGRILIT